MRHVLGLSFQRDIGPIGSNVKVIAHVTFHQCIEPVPSERPGGPRLTRRTRLVSYHYCTMACDDWQGLDCEWDNMPILYLAHLLRLLYSGQTV